MRAAKEFNLTLARFDSEADNDMGIWDGKQFVIQVCWLISVICTVSSHRLHSLWKLHFSTTGV